MKSIKGIIILLTISVSIAFVINYFSPSGIALVGKWDKIQGVIYADTKQSVVEREREINIMKEMVEENQTLILDVRSTENFKKGHILNAESFPLSEFDNLIGKFYKTISSEQEIIVYCASIECHDSHVMAEKLTELGYQDVKVFAGGFSDWKKSGYKIEKD